MKLLTRTISLISLLCLVLGPIIGQDALPQSLIYKTHDDFQADNAAQSEHLEIRKELINKKGNQEGAKKIIIHDLKSDKKLKKTFAVKVGEEIYFQTSEIFRNLNKKDKIQTAYNPHSFLKVIAKGNGYYYTEMISANAWGQGLGAGLGGVIGGSIMNSANNLTGVVYDVELKEFNILRNCKDIGKFLEEKMPSYHIGCKDKRVAIKEVRVMIERLLNTEILNVAPEEETTMDEQAKINVFPHKSAWDYSSKLLINDEKYEVLPTEILSIEAIKNFKNVVCIQDSEDCVDSYTSEEGIAYIMIKYDKKSKRMVLEDSDESAYNFQMAILKRKRKK